MKSADTPVYLYSEEAVLPGLPAKACVARFLAVGEIEKKAAVLVLEERAYRQELTTVVVVAKGSGSISDAFAGEEVGVYVLPLDSRAGDTLLLLEGGLQPVLDWGALTTDRQRALRMQVKHAG
jgi:hypothetical protein